MTDILNPPAIIGETQAGRAAAVRKRLMMLVGDVNEATFDMAELLAEAEDGGLFKGWGYDTIYEYGEVELGLKERKIQYLVRIVGVCKAVGIKRADYEAAGVSKLREITRLDPNGSFFNPETKGPEPLNEHIVRLITDAEKYTGKELLEEVRRLQGLTGPDKPITKMYSVSQDTLDKVIKPAFELARRRLGSAGVDENGNAKEYSDGVCIEMICAEFLADPNQYPETDTIEVEAEGAHPGGTLEISREI